MQQYPDGKIKCPSCNGRGHTTIGGGFASAMGPACPMCKGEGFLQPANETPGAVVEKKDTNHQYPNMR